jgi:hypothetical protein
MEICINGLEFKVERSGVIYRKRGTNYKLIEGSLKKSGYLFYDSGIIIRDKVKTRFKIAFHRLVACAYLGLDHTNKKLCLDHINGIRNDNRVDNLRIVSNQQNCFNRKNVKGFSTRNNKFIAEIQLNGQTIPLGTFDNERDARNAYLVAKQKYHIIPLRTEMESLYLIKKLAEQTLLSQTKQPLDTTLQS